ncbi:TIM-barrel domain-containing protein [Limnovirga soli]|uniref:DUF5110 domain-containing protein n=1 Tax=Limnovirga soli TaxID=2656915 RepID=A0A8J8JTC8_9BACT|nr:TIM-barrel domain-containing protein [Limnovirga soli]NNV57902.1 DUF5110 domain-containing protein [Limnovirga soli]
MTKKANHIGARILIFFGAFLCLLTTKAYAQEFVKTANGVIIYTNNNISGGTGAVRVQIISPTIIRVTASPSATFPAVESLITNYKNLPAVNWQADSISNAIIVKTDSLIVTVQCSTGTVSFTKPDGTPVLAERPYNGRHLQPVVFSGQPSWQINQLFELAPNDAIYGLGQHQDDMYNYRNQQVTFFQNNTEVAVPFLVSNHQYGILWDNNSISRVGDTRPFQSIGSLKLFDKNNKEGWLTASYSNNHNQLSQVAFTKAESDINYEFLNDSKLFLPADFDVAHGAITWEGAIQSGFTGMHKFRFTYGGYMKVWLNDSLLLDRWRQPWNPGVALLNLPLQQNNKYQIRIQWIPDGGESYISVKWLNPVPEADKNSFGFSSEAGKHLDYYFVYGQNIDSLIAGYRLLTGKATMLPSWALGFWQSRERYTSQKEILQTVDEFRKRRIPLDNIVQDWSYWKQDDWGSQVFDTTRFPNADSMIQLLHQKYHTHFMISVWPKFYKNIDAYNQFNAKGWLYTRNIANGQRDWIGKGYVSTFYDAFNKDAQKGFWDLLNTKLYNKGIDAWWMDASEPDILSNVSPQKRKEEMQPFAAGLAEEYLNAYPLENAKGIYEGQRSVNDTSRVFILTRSAFAGLQRYAAATWSGDIASRWEDMKAQITAGINFSMSGLPYWTMDIGGFAVEHRYEKPNSKDLEEWRELNTRWYQFGVFCPLFRVHGQYPYREIYNTSPEGHEAYNSMLYYDKLRYALMPYIYSIAGQTYHNNYTIMRGLVMDFEKDTATYNIHDQYMFGPSLLINPVYNYGAKSRNVYLPAGQGWYNFYNGQFYEGAQTITADAPYGRLPLFVKEGAIIPVGPALQYTNEKPADTITLFVFTGKDAAFTLYEDENTNYSYEQGAYANIGINYSQQNKTITIQQRQGSFKGMLSKRIFRIVWVTKDNHTGIIENAKAKTLIHYNGKAITVRMK